MTPARRAVEAIRAGRGDLHRRSAVRPWCRRCLKLGHLKADCKAPLFVWTNGPDFFIAETAERTARIWNAPLGPDNDDDLYTAPEHWVRVDTPITANGVTLPAADWVDLYGEGFLMADGELAPRRP